MRPGANWGATAAELTEPMPCDTVHDKAGVQADRSITIDAPTPTVFLWLCQLRVAPYSYDVLDNFGRRSPRQRDPELRRLQTGQRFMTIFTLHSFGIDEQITLRTGSVAVTYAVRSDGDKTRLHVRVLFTGPRLLSHVLALGDLVMMRKQLLTLKALAEREAALTKG